MALQLLRDTMHALPRDDGLRPRLRGAVECLNRDVVDAERQLRMGTDGPEEAQEEGETDGEGEVEETSA